VADSQIARIRERAVQMRRIAEMAHDPKMIEMLLKMANEAEADAAALQGELVEVQVPPPQQS
jgi:hypothetical protein